MMLTNGSGNGNGYGYGNGYGSGYGNGYGYGSGDGSGYGDGNRDGYWDEEEQPACTRLLADATDIGFYISQLHTIGGLK